MNECDGSPSKRHSQDDYDRLGLSPCGKYVAHWIGRVCNIGDIPIQAVTDKDHNCVCATGMCPCGSFVSHRIDQLCTAKL